MTTHKFLIKPSVSKFNAALAGLFLAFMGPGCASLHADLPISRFESPETNGVEHRFGFQNSLGSAHNDTISPDASHRPPDFSQPRIDEDVVLGLAASFGLVENLDVSVRGSLGPTPTMFVAKYQLLGPAARSAVEGDVSVAVTAAIGGGRSNRSGDQSGLFGPGGHNWTGTVEEQTTDVALIVGQRLAKHFLLYGGGFYSNYTINSSVDQNPSDDGSSPGASYSQTVTGYQRGGNVGLEFMGGGWTALVEGVYSDVHVSNMGHSLLRVGVAGGFNF
jgi:hypothetical protein